MENELQKFISKVINVLNLLKFLRSEVKMK